MSGGQGHLQGGLHCSCIIYLLKIIFSLNVHFIVEMFATLPCHPKFQYNNLWYSSESKVCP